MSRSKRTPIGYKRIQELHSIAYTENILLMTLLASFKRCPRWRLIKRLRLLYAVRVQEAIARQAALRHKEEGYARRSR